MAMYALVLQGLPTTRTLTSRLATASSALPCSVKMAPLAESSSERSMPLVRGRAPTRIAASASLKATIGSAVDVMSARSGKAQSANSIITPLRRAALWHSQYCRQDRLRQHEQVFSWNSLLDCKLVFLLGAQKNAPADRTLNGSRQPLNVAIGHFDCNANAKARILWVCGRCLKIGNSYELTKSKRIIST